MVFYRRTRVLVSAAELVTLLRICGPESLCAALENGFLELVYLENHLAVGTINGGSPNERHGLVFVDSTVQQLEEWTYRKLLLWTDNRRKSRSITDRVVRSVKAEKWRAPEAEAARNDLLDPEFTNACGRAAVQHLTRGYIPPEGAFFNINLESDSTVENRGIRFDLSIETNFDINSANTIYQRYVDDEKFDKTSVLIGVFAALADLRTMASYSDEMAVSPAVHAIAETKFARLLYRREQSAERIHVFQERTCGDGRAIREAVNAKHKNFDDVLRLAEAAGRFKAWLAQHDESDDIREEYLKPCPGAVGLTSSRPKHYAFCFSTPRAKC